jgi:hypothetical protein
MAGCSLEAYNLELACDTPVGGANREFVYVGQLSDYPGQTIDVSALVVDPSVFATAYPSLRKIAMAKKMFDSGCDTRQADVTGLHIGYTHKFMGAFYLPENASDQEITDALTFMETLDSGNNLFFIVPGADDVIRLYGGQNGMRKTEGTQQRGMEASSDASHKRTFLGEYEEFLPAVVKNGGTFASIIAELDALVVV